MQRTGQTLPCQAPSRPSYIPGHPSLNRRCNISSLCSKIWEHSIIPCTSFRRRPESSVIYSSTRGRHLGSGCRRSDEYTVTGPFDAFDTGSKRNHFHQRSYLR